MMKMNYTHWTRRILACMAVFCLTVTAFGAQPAQASPPSGDPLPYNLFMKIKNPPPCVILKKPVSITVEFRIEPLPKPVPLNLTPKPVPLIPGPVPILYLGRGTGAIRTTITANKVSPPNLDDPPKQPLKQLQWGKTETRTITYTPNQVGQETIVVTFSAEVERKGNWVVHPPAKLPFEVKECKFNFHGSVDPGKYTNTMYAAFGLNDWDAVGAYDIAGSFAIDEDGIHGKGTTDYFLAYFWTGQGEMGAQGITCEREPLEGASEVEVNGDLAALADAGTLNLEFRLAPMAFNASPVVCRDPEGGSGFSNESPAGTMPAFTLPADPISTWGGRTILREGGDIQMELIVSPQEAES